MCPIYLKRLSLQQKSEKKTEYIMKFMYVLALGLCLVGCESPFDYHPYDVRIKGEADINAKNIAKIEEACRDKNSLCFAVMSDSHGWYTETDGAVASINSNPKIDFVIHGGDLTDCGTTKEFMWQRDVLSALQVPYVALIGNHDFLGTGDEAYSRIYGKLDFSFIASRIKFVCLNTNATEYDYLAAVPNFDYIEEQRTADIDRFDRTIVCMHARPYSDQFNNNVAKSFEYYIRLLPQLMFCISGHDHKLQVDELYSDGTVYYGSDCMAHRNYLLFTITPDSYEYEVVYF